MAKFIKSIFQDRKISRAEGDLEERPDFTPPLDGRRKLSISRSGRMKQSKKKRNSLSLELYGDDIPQGPQKLKSLEYHVGVTPANTPRSPIEPGPPSYQSRPATEVTNPDEEIDKAFEIIDKT